jgi:hypothetical protein
MTTTTDLDDLRRDLAGPVFVPGSPGYDEARAVMNAGNDLRPAVVARCTSAADVTAALGYAQRHGLEIAVRAGAHNMAGLSSVEGGLVVDLSGMRQVTVDPIARRARVQGGALLADLDAATQEHGLAVTTGLVGHTGVAGLTLGGGMGWLTRKIGLAIDNLESVEIVVADGRTLRASESENPDLFWAVRGGGGNFGVVTEFEFRLHEVGPMVQVGLLFWELDRGPAALRTLREVIGDMPPDVNGMISMVNVPPAPFIPEEHHHEPVVGVILVGLGDPDQFQDVADRLRASLPPLVDAVIPIPYSGLQGLFDEVNCWGRHYYEKSCLLPDFTDDAIEVLLDHFPRRSSPDTVVLSYRLDAAYCAPAEDATAFGGERTPRYATFLLANTPDAESLTADRTWTRSLWEALRPMSLGAGTYVNGMADDEPDRVEASYGPAKYARLREIKGRYDPGNLFHRNANIKPA